MCRRPCASADYRLRADDRQQFVLQHPEPAHAGDALDRCDCRWQFQRCPLAVSASEMVRMTQAATAEESILRQHLQRASGVA